MKKLLFFAFIIICLTFSLSFKTQNFLVFASSIDASFSFYTVGATNQKIKHATTVQNGRNEIIVCPSFLCESVFNKLQSATLGYSFFASKDKVKVNQIIDYFEVKLLKKEVVGDSEVFYGYSNKLGDAIAVDGQYINIQIAQSKKGITCGTPIIMTSF